MPPKRKSSQITTTTAGDQAFTASIGALLNTLAEQKGAHSGAISDAGCAYLDELETALQYVHASGPQSLGSVAGTSAASVQLSLPAEPGPRRSKRAKVTPPAEAAASSSTAPVKAEAKIRGRGRPKGTAKGKGKGKAKAEPEESPQEPEISTGEEKEEQTEGNNEEEAGHEKESEDEERPVQKTERRLKKWRSHAPIAVKDRLARCRYQRMFVIGRERVEGASPPEEKFKMAGTTGNVYTVHIKKVPKCTCPDGKKSGTCKHILYVMLKVLRARNDLVYQAALLSFVCPSSFPTDPPQGALTNPPPHTQELEEIFSNAPSPASEPTKSSRKPLDSDDCPICYDSIESDATSVWCRAMCGTNIHKDCFARWSATANGGKVNCVMCRTPWVYGQGEGPTGQVSLEKAKKGSEGYVNVADQLGISSERHYYGNSRWYSRGYYRRGWW
ncbi:hypothetical protein BDZ91DRAFT_712017 [Kalaharituber pfeilii]|nr:hypothetical protein BDZ91DRAFT_712017 [Kalaharituber pfeilii]